MIRDAIPVLALYQKPVGSVINLMMTCPYISYIVHITTHYIVDHCHHHMKAAAYIAYIILCLHGTLEHGLSFPSYSTSLSKSLSGGELCWLPRQHTTQGWHMFLADNLISLKPTNYLSEISTPIICLLQDTMAIRSSKRLQHFPR